MAIPSPSISFARQNLCQEPAKSRLPPSPHSGRPPVLQPASSDPKNSSGIDLKLSSVCERRAPQLTSLSSVHARPEPQIPVPPRTAAIEIAWMKVAYRT